MSVFRRRRDPSLSQAPRYMVREAAQADLPELLAMKAASWREAYGHLREESFFQAAESTLDRQVEHWRTLLRTGTSVWLAEDERGRFVGIASAGPARPDRVPDRRDLPATELTTLYVLIEAQGTGVADALIARALEAAPAFLHVVSVNARARAFYRRHGFHDDGPPTPLDGAWAGLSEQLMVREEPDGA